MSRRIAYLTGEYPRATDTFIQREVAGLRALGLQVETCSVRRTGAQHHVGEEQRQEAARTFHVLEAAKNPARLLAAHAGLILRRPRAWLRALRLALATSPGGLRAHAYQLFYFAEAGVLARHMARQRVDHLHNHIAKSSCTVAMLASELSGIPYSFTLHGPDIFFEPIHWRLDEKIARAAFVACISDFCRSQGMAFSDPRHWDKLHVVHCGVDPARYAPDAARVPDRQPDRQPGRQLLFVGRLAAVKGLPVLLEALDGVPHDFNLMIVGDGPDRAALEARVAGSALAHKVEFLGYRSQSEVAALLADSDLFVLPSFAEGLPVVLMEALAGKVPVVSTRIAGIPELVEDGVTGRLCPPGDAGALRAAIATQLNDPAQARAMAARGRERVVAQFDSHAEAARLATLIETSLTGGPKPSKRPDPAQGA